MFAECMYGCNKEVHRWQPGGEHRGVTSVQVHERMFGSSAGSSGDGAEALSQDVREHLRAVQLQVLAGCRLVFSRIVPQGDPAPQLHHLWRLAEQARPPLLAHACCALCACSGCSCFFPMFCKKHSGCVLCSQGASCCILPALLGRQDKTRGEEVTRQDKR